MSIAPVASGSSVGTNAARGVGISSGSQRKCSLSGYLEVGGERSKIRTSASAFYVVNSFSLMVAFKAYFNLASPVIRSVLNQAINLCSHAQGNLDL